MYIKKPSTNPNLKKNKSKISQYVLIFIVFTGLLFFTAAKCISLGIQLHREDRGATFKNFFIEKSTELLTLIPNYISSVRATTPRLIIDIKHEDFQKLAYKRDEALKRGVLFSSSDDFVPTKITYTDKTVKAKIRLKGDLVDQLDGEKWPFRIVIKGEETIMGMKVFSIHDPKARNNMYEWFFHWMMRKEGIIAPRYDFVDVIINGKNLGLFAIEEHFEKRLLENNNRREGPIIFFDEEVDITSLGIFGWQKKRPDFFSAKINLYQDSKTLANPELHKNFINAKNLLEAFRREEITTCEAFDCEIMGRYLAMLDLLMARHAAKFGNLKFYYNPITAKLEPISYDAEYIGTNILFDGFYGENWYLDEWNFVPLLFKDKHLFKVYLREFLRFSQASYLDQAFKESKNELDEIMKKIHTYNPYLHFRKENIVKAQYYMLKFLNFPLFIHANFDAYSEENGKKYIDLSIMNILPVPLNILHANLGSAAILETEKPNIILDPSFSRHLSNVQRIRFVLPDDIEWQDEYKNQLYVQSTMIGLNLVNTQPVIPWDYYNENQFEKELLKVNTSLPERSYLTIDNKNKTITFKNGINTVNEDLIIPLGYTVYAFENTQIQLSNKAKIISYSPLIFEGTENNPIIFESPDSTGQGLLIIDVTAETKSIFNYVKFKNLSNPSGEHWQITGAVNFYNAEVEMNYCEFDSNNSEDSLNLIQSPFTITDTVFRNAPSDAFDSDFSSGTIKNSSFLNSKNDALDFSGSTVTLENITINSAGDKGISVGEKSSVKLVNININSARSAIVSKDYSTVLLSEALLTNCDYGLLLYQKKSEFGPSRITAEKVEFKNVTDPYIVEKGSSLILDEITIKHAELEVPSFIKQ